MLKLDLEKYFDGTDNKYYDSNFLISILEKVFEKDIDEIKNSVNNAEVSVSKDEIVRFLERKFQEEEPELKEKIENLKPINNKNSGKLTDEDIKEISQIFVDKLSAERYYFEPYTLEYFNRYTSIVKSKALELLNIIELIGNKQSMKIQDLLTELDIRLDDNGNITREDIIRLITPTVQNINELNQKTKKANDLSTYLTFKMTKHSLYRGGWSEEEIYPNKSIFIKNIDNGYSYGNIPISNNQKQELDEKFKRNVKVIAKTIIKL